MNSKGYWDNKIIEWENSTRKFRGVPFIEKFASRFRQPLKHRLNVSLDILQPFVKDKVVLELGCGSGFFGFELYNRLKPRHITGIDFSSKAIERAQKIAREKNLTDKFEFLEGNITSAALPQADITIGLGLLDYLTSEEIKNLFDRMKSSYFLFSFAEKKVCIRRYAHILYLWSQKCPKHFYYTKKEITNCIGNKYGGYQFLGGKKMGIACIIHNLPRFPEGVNDD